MYTSSTLTIFCRYYLPIVLGGLYIIGVLLSDMSSSESIFSLLLFVIFAVPTYLLTLGQLRYIKAMHNKLITKTLNYEEEIAYERVNYIYQTALTNPVLIRISYKESETGKTQNFYAMGSLSERMFIIDPFNLKELELTKFIRGKVLECQPNYNESQEPSRWRIPVIAFVLLMLFYIIGFLVPEIIGK